jgi:quercetin dioxygenase-like cupin family protein
MDSDVLKAGEGRSTWAVGDRYTIKTSGQDSGGAFAIFEALVPSQSGPPPHRHSREDEAFYVLEGELEFHVDGRQIVAGTGAWITLAKGSLHRFKNIGQSPARLLILVVPAGLDEFFLEVGREGNPLSPDTPVTVEPGDIEKMVAVAPKYGIEIVLPVIK